MDREANTQYPIPGSMIDSYDYAAPISFDPQYGWLKAGSFPAECISDCSHSGQCDADVEHWRKQLNFSAAIAPVRHLAERYLREFGAWDDLADVDLDTLADRVLWIACGDINEQGEWFGLCH